jgi:hypothetical protein
MVTNVIFYLNLNTRQFSCSQEITRAVNSKDRAKTSVMLSANRRARPPSSVRSARQGLARAVSCSLPAPYSCRPFETWTIRFHFICVMYIIHGFHYTVHQGWQKSALGLIISEFSLSYRTVRANRRNWIVSANTEASLVVSISASVRPWIELSLVLSVAIMLLQWHLWNFFQDPQR